MSKNRKRKIETLSELEKFKIQYKREGSLDHAGKTLMIKFTPEEIDALFLIFWNSEAMNTIRARIQKLEKEAKE